MCVFCLFVFVVSLFVCFLGFRVFVYFFVCLFVCLFVFYWFVCFLGL